MSPGSDTLSVGIVGAGVAGLATARLLQERGHSVALFDKGRGLGGRLARRRTRWANLDIGAPFFHLSQNGAALLRHLAPDLVLNALPWLQQSWHSGSGLSAPHKIHQLYATAANSNRLCHSLAQGLTLTLAARVTAIRQDDHSATLWDDADNLLGRFDAVVIATPADQCAALLPAASSIDLASHCMVPRWSLQLHLEAPPALLSSAHIVDLPDHPVIERLVNLSALPERQHQHCVQLCLQPGFASANKDRDDDGIGEMATEALAALAPLPRVLNWELQRWRLGGNRCAKLSSIVDQPKRLVVAGDWSAGGNHVDAALHSAERACSAMASFL